MIIQNGPISSEQAKFIFHIFTENWFFFFFYLNQTPNHFYEAQHILNPSEILAHPRYRTQGAHFDSSLCLMFCLSNTRLVFVVLRGAVGQNSTVWLYIIPMAKQTLPEMTGQVTKRVQRLQFNTRQTYKVTGNRLLKWDTPKVFIKN